MNDLKAGRGMSKGVRRWLFWLGGLFLFGVVVVLLPLSCFQARERAWRISCAGNLKNVGLGLKMWAGDHGEIYPERLADIGRYLGFQPTLFRCFGSGNEPGTFETVDEWTDYVYVSGLPESVHPSTVLMYCPAKNHRDKGGNVLFADGHVEWFNSEIAERDGMESSLYEVIARIQEPLLPPTTPTDVTPAETNPQTRIYVVGRNEDLYSVALLWDVKLARLKKINRLTDTTLRPGQRLIIPLGDSEITTEIGLQAPSQ